MPATPDDESTNRAAGAVYYREFLQEREEILRHKWFMSEKARHDVGFEAALLDWVNTARPVWRKAQKGK